MVIPSKVNRYLFANNTINIDTLGFSVLIFITNTQNLICYIFSNVNYIDRMSNHIYFLNALSTYLPWLDFVKQGSLRHGNKFHVIIMRINFCCFEDFFFKLWISFWINVKAVELISLNLHHKQLFAKL